MRLKFLILPLGFTLGLLGLSFFLSGCTSSEDENTIPWSQPSGWENNRMPGVMPTYGDRSY